MVIVADVVQITTVHRGNVTLVLVAKQVHLDLLLHHIVPHQKKVMVLLVPTVVNVRRVLVVVLIVVDQKDVLLDVLIVTRMEIVPHVVQQLII